MQNKDIHLSVCLKHCYGVLLKLTGDRDLVFLLDSGDFRRLRSSLPGSEPG